MQVSSGKYFRKKLLPRIRSGDKEKTLEVPCIERAQTSELLMYKLTSFDVQNPSSNIHISITMR